MSLGHEKLDVYRLSIEYVAWVYTQSAELNGVHRHARDQWLRASQSIPLNIAEGNGKSAQADRRRYFEIARGSALECAAIQDVLTVGGALEAVEHHDRKIHLDRIATMLSKLGGEALLSKKNKQFMEERESIGRCRLRLGTMTICCAIFAFATSIWISKRPIHNKSVKLMVRMAVPDTPE